MAWPSPGVPFLGRIKNEVLVSKAREVRTATSVISGRSRTLRFEVGNAVQGIGRLLVIFGSSLERSVVGNPDTARFSEKRKDYGGSTGWRVAGRRLVGLAARLHPRRIHKLPLRPEVHQSRCRVALPRLPPHPATPPRRRVRERVDLLSRSIRQLRLCDTRAGAPRALLVLRAVHDANELPRGFVRRRRVERGSGRDGRGFANIALDRGGVHVPVYRWVVR